MCVAIVNQPNSNPALCQLTVLDRARLSLSLPPSPSLSPSLSLSLLQISALSTTAVILNVIIKYQDKHLLVKVGEWHAKVWNQKGNDVIKIRRPSFVPLFQLLELFWESNNSESQHI